MARRGESDVQAQILEFLRLNGIYAWPVRESQWSRKGLADICGVVPPGLFPLWITGSGASAAAATAPFGCHLEVECKNPDRKWRYEKGQKEHLDRVRERGGMALVATSVKQVQEYLEGAGVHLRARLDGGRE